MGKIKPILTIATTAVMVLGILLVVYASAKYGAAYFGQTGNTQEIANDDQSMPVSKQETSTEINAEIKDGTDTDSAKKQQGKNANADLSSKVLYPQRPDIGEHIGDLDIPELEISLSIVHGTGDEQLEEGVGHYAGSVLPGESDHSILSGHRDTVFRGLKDIELKDDIIISTSAGTFTYQVVDTYIVDAEDETVIQPADEPTLSLTTCYPFDFVGNAPKRFIVEADLTDYELK